MPIVNTAAPLTWARCDETIRKLTAEYPFCRTEVIGTTAFQRSLRTLVIGNGPRKVVYTAAHHGNEWITALILLKFCEDFAQAIRDSGSIGGVSARELRERTTFYMVPMVDPDGVDLVTGAILPGSAQYALAQELGDRYPAVPFPSGWKANLLGVDLNLNYPAGWSRAKEIKFAQGYTRPGPRDFVGRAPLDQLETRALFGYTQFLNPSLVLAFHSQGREIYWQFRDYYVPGARELGERLAAVSGYRLADVPYNSSFAGYKDWFIQEFRRPGYTVEVGSGVNPLPLSQFPRIYRDNLGILVTAGAGEL